MDQKAPFFFITETFEIHIRTRIAKVLRLSRTSRWWRFLFPVFLIAFDFSGVALAAEYRWMEPANAQVFLIRDSKVDLDVRLFAIDRATKSIESVTYSQGIDPELGLPLLKAFRRAQSKGVSGRYIYDKLGSIFNDPFNKAWRMLADANLQEPGQVVAFGGLTNILAGLNITDMVHEKILILDAGTPHEIVFIGGRNNSRINLDQMDLTLVIRRLDPMKPYIGDQIREVYESLWTTAKKVHAPIRPQKLIPKLAFLLESNKSYAPKLSEKQQAFSNEIKEVLSRQPELREPLRAFEERPSKMRVLTNEFIDYALTRIYGKTYNSRKNMPSDIVDAAAPVVAKSKKIYLSLMSVFMPDSFKESLKTALKNGAEVHLVTNGREAFRFMHVRWGAAYEHSLKDILELMNENKNLHVYVLDESIWSRASEEEKHNLGRFIHRKIVIADDVIFTGSDNFNESSRSRSSEMVVQFEDPNFAKRMRIIVERDLALLNRLSCEAALLDYKEYGLVKRALNWLLRPIY